MTADVIPAPLWRVREVNTEPVLFVGPWHECNSWTRLQLGEVAGYSLALVIEPVPSFDSLPASTDPGAMCPDCVHPVRMHDSAGCKRGREDGFFPCLCQTPGSAPS